MSKTTESLNIDALRQRAREHIEEGAVTAGYQGDRQAVLKMLNDDLADLQQQMPGAAKPAQQELALPAL